MDPLRFAIIVHLYLRLYGPPENNGQRLGALNFEADNEPRDDDDDGATGYIHINQLLKVNPLPTILCLKAYKSQRLQTRRGLEQQHCLEESELREIPKV